MRLRDIIEMMDKKYSERKGLDDYELEWYLKELWRVSAVALDQAPEDAT